MTTQTEAGAETDWFSNDAATFGDRVAWAREAVGMDQADLAKRLGVKIKTLQAWEKDTAEPRANRLTMISGLLNVSIPWLLMGEGKGLETLETAPAPDRDLQRLLVELREIRTRMIRDAERIGVLEKQLRRQIAANAETALG